MKVDLHIHSTASDGCWEPKEIIEEIQKCGIKLFAIADHDNLSNVNLTMELAYKNNLNFIPAVEITTKFNDCICHILGYGIDPNNAYLKKLCRKNIEIWDELNIKQINDLIEKGFDIDIEDFKNYQVPKKRGGGKSTNYLIDKGFFPSFKDSLKYVAKNLDWTTPKYPDVKTVATAIKTAGGYSVVAHPFSSLIGRPYKISEIRQMIKKGIEGIECYSTYHNKEETKLLLKFCKENKMLITAGSDCHGPLLKERKIGQPRAFLSDISLGHDLEKRFIKKP